MFRTALRLAGEVRRLRRDNAALLAALGTANRATEGWRARAELLYALAPQPIADEVLRDQGRIESLEETT
jgi:hypothetical protein